VTFTLAPVLGACGRVCNATYTCQPSGYQHICSGGDAAVSQTVFEMWVACVCWRCRALILVYRHYNASLGVNSPVCKSSVAGLFSRQYARCANLLKLPTVIDSATYTIGSSVCTYFTTGGSSDLELAQGDFNPSGITGNWILIEPTS
jgi:hypothetical protein